MLVHAILSLFLLFLTASISGLPSQQNIDQEISARQARIEAFYAQRPMHTTALLAGAAATPAANSKTKAQEMRISDLRTVTGESGMWVNLEDFRRTSSEKDDGEEASRAKEKVDAIWQREGWDAHAVEI